MSFQRSWKNFMLGKGKYPGKFLPVNRYTNQFKRIL
jgi:hypothetical protein